MPYDYDQEYESPSSELEQFLKENEPGSGGEVGQMVDLLSAALSGELGISSILDSITPPTQGTKTLRAIRKGLNGIEGLEDTVRIKRLRDKGFVTASGKVNQERLVELNQDVSFSDVLEAITTPLVGAAKKRFAKTRQESSNLLEEQGYTREDTDEVLEDPNAYKRPYYPPGYFDGAPEPPEGGTLKKLEDWQVLYGEQYFNADGSKKERMLSN